MIFREVPLAGGECLGARRLCQSLFHTLEAVVAIGMTAKPLSKPPPKSVTHVLSTPELVILILQDFERSEDLNHAALVCRRWSALALDMKWRVIEVRLTRLLDTLGRHTEVVGRDWLEVSLYLCASVCGDI